MRQEIPLLSGVAAQRFRVRLGHQYVRIELYYNTYSRDFFISLYQPYGDPIVEGLKMALHATPFRFAYEGFEGQIFWMGEGLISIDSIGVSHRLFYEHDNG